MFFALINFVKSIPVDSPALMDILKVIVGSTVWIGSLITFMYMRERKLKTQVTK